MSPTNQMNPNCPTIPRMSQRIRTMTIPKRIRLTKIPTMNQKTMTNRLRIPTNTRLRTNSNSYYWMNRNLMSRKRMIPKNLAPGNNPLPTE
jgi:hypothetical protein